MLDVVWLEMFVSGRAGSLAYFWGTVETLSHDGLGVHRDFPVKRCIVLQSLVRTWEEAHAVPDQLLLHSYHAVSADVLWCAKMQQGREVLWSCRLNPLPEGTAGKDCPSSLWCAFSLAFYRVGWGHWFAWWTDLWLGSGRQACASRVHWMACGKQFVCPALSVICWLTLYWNRKIKTLLWSLLT